MVKTLRKAVKWYCEVTSKVYVSEDGSKSKNSVLSDYCRYLTASNK